MSSCKQKLAVSSILLLIITFQSILVESKRLPRVIAHRGSSGYVPELTLEAFRQAVQDGADVIEADISITKDGQLAILHEPELSVSTNALDLKKQNIYPFSDPSKYRQVTVQSGDTLYYTKQDLWSFDFTMSELKQLRKRQVLPYRNQENNDKYLIPSLIEVIQEVILKSHRKVVLMIEIKTCTFFNHKLKELGFSQTVEDLLIDNLRDNEMLDRSDLIELVSYNEEECLHRIKLRAPKLRAYHTLISSTQLTEATFQRLRNRNFYGIAVPKQLLTTGNYIDYVAYTYRDKYTITGSTDLVEKFHNMGFKILVGIFKNEDRFLPWNFRQDPQEEILFYAKTGVDGLVTDFPNTARKAIQCLSDEGETGYRPGNSDDRQDVWDGREVVVD